MRLSRELDAAELKRLEEAWRDPEVTITGIRERFRLGWGRDSDELAAEFGPKARPVPCGQMHPSRRRQIAERARAKALKQVSR